MKGGEQMEPKSYERKAAEAYDSLCKKIIKFTAIDCHNWLNRRDKNEKVFSELTIRESAQLAVRDMYFAETYNFDVMGETVTILNDSLVEALNDLSAVYRNIILASLLFNMPDRVIAERMHKKRRTVAYQRVKAMTLLKRIMETETRR
jgi:DNA-directed RNA polymerase specialized sigma24 family protein